VSVEADIQGMPGARKAAILMTMLTEEAAASLFHHLTEDDLQGLTYEIARLGTVPKEVSLKVLEEYQQMTAAHDHISAGGKEVATRMLVKAFGEIGAAAMVQRLVRSQEVNSSRVESLQRVDPKQLARFLEGEHPQTIALILGHLETKQASALLMCLPQKVRAESVRRLANLRQFSPAMAEKVAVVLNRRLRSIGDQKKKTYSGFQSVADLMNNIDATTSGEILDAIEREEAQLAVSIRDLMFTFDDFKDVSEVQLRVLTGALDKKTLTLALKSASEGLKDHFFSTMSSRAIEMLKEESEQLGPVRSKDVAKAQMDVVSLARKLEAEGKMILKSEGADEYVF
jgi:flagellar motor switch protein FliG